jgi:hypothetical protein
VKTVGVTPDPQVKSELEIPHEPFDDFNVNPESGPHFVSLLIALFPDKPTRCLGGVSSASPTRIPCSRTDQTANLATIRVCIQVTF